jgi:hypothetical protein
MRKLFEAIQRFLAQRFGITEDRTYFQDYNNTFTIKCTVKMVPDGKKVEEDVNLYCSFYFNESNRRAKGGQRTVTFGDYKYRRPLEYVDKIVVDMLKRLPAKLEEEKARWLASSRRAEAAKIGALLQGTGLFMSSDSCTDGLILSFRHHDKLTVMEAANFLQDNGFCGRTSERPPQADEVKFIVRNMLDLFNLLTEEERFAFLQNLPMDLITAVHLNQTTEAQS